jgi:Helix-turn-helix domain
MTQQQAVLDILKKGKTLNILSAFKLTGSMKLSTRISDFRKLGYVFKVKKIHFKTRYKTNGCYCDYTLDLKKTPKKLLK